MNVARVTEGRERHDPGQRERGLLGERRKVVHPSSSSKTARCRQRLNRKLTPAPVRTRTWMQRGCTCAHAPPRTPTPPPTQYCGSGAHARPCRMLLTFLPHAAFQTLAEAAGLALPPSLPGDLAGALPEEAPGPGIAFDGPPARGQRAKGRPRGAP